MTRYSSVSAAEVADDPTLADWRFVLGALRAEFVAESFAEGAALAAEMAVAADEADHHPDLAIRWPGRIIILLTTHDTGGVTNADVDLAREFSALAARQGATSKSELAQAIELAIDTMDADRIRPFWAAVLGYKERHGMLVDPAGLGPPVWFQQMDEARVERNRFHLDVSVPHDQAESRIAAAVEAGGVVVSDARARAFWILADAEGNEACICTWQDR